MDKLAPNSKSIVADATRTDDTDANRSSEHGAEERQPFLTARFDGLRLRLLVGFAAFSAWMNLLICFEGFLRDSVAMGGGVVHDPLFVSAMVVGGFLLIARGIRTQRTNRLSPMRAHRSFSARTDIAACLAGTTSGVGGVLLSATATASGPAVTAASWILGILAGIFIAYALLTWGLFITSFDIREMIVVLCAALCLQWVPFIAITLLGTAGKALLAALLPVLCWWGLKGVREKELARTAEDVPDATREPDDGQKSANLIARIGATLFCFSFVVAFVWTSNIVMTSDPLDQSLFWLVYVFVTGATASVMLFSLQLMERWGAYRMELFYRMAFFFGVVGSAALPLAFNHLFFSYAIIYVAYALISATMWMLAWSIVFMRRASGRRVVGLVFGLECLALPCGFAAAQLTRSFIGADTAEALSYVCFASVAVLVAAYTFVLPERSLLLLSPRLLKLSHESLDKRCREVAAEKGLTERETEIFTLLARGRDVGYIEKELFISRNTVNTHRKNLYRKLGVHTQQELLSLIESGLS